MYCQKCGAVLNAGDKFCTSCGAPISAPSRPSAPAHAKPAAPVYAKPAAPVYTPIGTIAPKAEKRRSVSIAAILFASFATGSFLQNAVSACRYFGYIGDSGFRNAFYGLSIIFSALLLFLSALFLLISIAKELPDGKRPVLGGIALLFLSLAFGFSLIQYMIGTRITRWPNFAYAICFALSSLSFLVAAILAFANKRFAVPGLIGAIFYIVLQVLMVVCNLSMRPRMPGYPVTEIIVSDILPYLLRIFYGVSLMIFSLKFRPQKR